MPVRDLNPPLLRQYEALQRAERKRVAREAQMLNALEILSWFDLSEHVSPRAAGQFVRATAREGLGRE